jgi:membrane carboxypeptidase/penicillin-binding protein
MTDGSFAMLAFHAVAGLAGAPDPERGNMILTGMYPCYDTYRCADGEYVSLGALEAWFWERLVAALGRDDLAGKTGSTNDHRDAWFSGFNGGLVATVWVGFDDFSSLGKGEFGAKAALPIWMSYMGSVLKDQPSSVLPMPPGISTVQIDRYSGLPAGAGDPNAMSEIFKVEDVDRLRNQANQQQEDQDQQHAYDIF